MTPDDEIGKISGGSAVVIASRKRTGKNNKKKY
jgi:hypothetical protein